MSVRKVAVMVCAGILGIGVISALDAGHAVAKAKKAAKINALNYGVTCTGQSGSTTFSPALKLPGTTAGRVKVGIKATLVALHGNASDGRRTVDHHPGRGDGQVAGLQGYVVSAEHRERGQPPVQWHLEDQMDHLSQDLVGDHPASGSRVGPSASPGPRRPTPSIP